MSTIGLKGFRRYHMDRFFAGSLLVSIGILLTTTGGSWDITNHLINRPETFFSIPHTVLYAGVVVAIVGTIIMLQAYRRQKDQLKSLSTKMALIGSLLLVVAGPADFGWHQAFGLDGLLSPTHMTLVVGMLCSSLGGLFGIRRSIYDKTNPKPKLTTVLAMLPTWLAATGMLDMLSLPFSNTAHFKFNPDPTLAAILATVAFPFLSSVILISISSMSRRRFGCLSALGTSFVAVAILTTIIPDDKIRISIPFYLINLIPIVVADIILSMSQKKSLTYLAGAILGLGFFTLYFPWITHVYNEILTTAPVWPSAIIDTYFADLAKFYPIVLLPSIAIGVLGAIASKRLVKVQDRKEINYF
jgi:hypothetical protein